MNTARTPLTDEQQRLVTDNYGLCVNAISRYRHLSPENYEDLLSHLTYQLCVSASKYNPGSPYPFGAYASKCLKGQICEYFDQHGFPAVKHPKELRRREVFTALNDDADELPECLAGQNLEMLLSCAQPISLDSDPPYGEESALTVDADIETRTVESLHQHAVLRAVFAALEPSERIHLAYRMKRKSMKATAEKLGMSAGKVQQAWQALQEKLTELYAAAGGERGHDRL